MLFFGAIVGLVIGAAIGGVPGALVGAVLGLIGGALFPAQTRPADAERNESRLASLERRLNELSQALAATNARLKAIDPTYPDTSGAAADAGLTAETPATDEAPVALAAAQTPEPGAATVTGRSALKDEPEPPAAAITPPLPAATPLWREWFFGGNTLVRAGIVVLFFGVGFLVKYAAEHAHFPIELRLACITAGAIAMLVVGWRLREKRPGYGLSMQGGAVGILYLTVFAALRLYTLLPPTLAFALLIVVVAASAMLAVVQDAMALAVIASAGGFLAPILTSSGHGDHVMLFSYYLLLNLGILAIAWVKAWRPLNVLGFAFTLVIGALWGEKNYTPENFNTTEPFLILFFLLYVGIALLYALRRLLEVQRYVDGTLVFGTPIAAFGLQSQLMKGTEYGLAFSALALAAFYIALASVLWSRRQRGMLLLVESFLSLGVVFATLTLPLALDGRWTSCTWALEGAAVVWIGGRQGRRLAQWFGVMLQVAAGVAFLAAGNSGEAIYPVANNNFLGSAFIALAGLFCGYRIHRHGDALGSLAPPVSSFLFLWGMMWWVGGGIYEIDRFVMPAYAANAHLLFLAASALAFQFLHARLQWPIAMVPQVLLLPSMVVLAFAAIVKAPHPFADLGWIAWPFTFAVLLWILRRSEDQFAAFVARTLHVIGLWLATGLACWEFAYWIDQAVQGDGTWPFVAWAAVPGLVLAGLTRFGERIAWPVAKHLALYLQAAALPIAAYLFVWVLVANVLSDGNPAPLVYVPLLNPLDLAMLLVLLVFAGWYAKLRSLEFAGGVLPRHAGAAIGFAAFVWLNGCLLRTLHHWTGMPYEFDPIAHSMLAQTSISVFWTVLGCATMLFATRRGLRTLWMVGGALLAVVVVKLFAIDLSHISGIERIVSFIGVGVLLLAIGYFSPVPPNRLEKIS